MAPVRHRWSINDVIGGIRNTVMSSDCSPLRFGIRSLCSSNLVVPSHRYNYFKHFDKYQVTVRIMLQGCPVSIKWEGERCRAEIEHWCIPILEHRAQIMRSDKHQSASVAAGGYASSRTDDAYPLPISACADDYWLTVWDTRTRIYRVDEIDGVCVCDIPLLKYARLTSCDVERSFSQYKSLFGDNRHAFVMENLEMIFVVHCNTRPTTSTQVWWRAFRRSFQIQRYTFMIDNFLAPKLNALQIDQCRRSREDTVVCCLMTRQVENVRRDAVNSESAN
ncbi:hypothetical protein ANN_02539 [Periplaneta americana]|uniref:Uncharacterized protein n=1 Tax=Periplaneta americana TaxID=6978 RepID=A0ABQ8TZV4_PERAM|nr:hypothetical protein ANN_02539 [Periplaneta americana]